jgi:copper transport protein
VRRACAAAVLVTAIVGALLAGAAPAAAHAGLVSSDPANGSVLQVSPNAITITFTEAPDLALSSLTVTDAGGAEAGLGDPSVNGTVWTVPITDTLGDGVYTVTWHVVSSEDGHVTSGTFSFGIGEAPTGAATETTAGPTVLGVAGKAALYTGLMLLAAIAVVGLGLFGGRPGTIRILAPTAGLLAFGGAIASVVAEQQAVGVSMGDLLAAESGRPLAWLLVTTLVAAGLAVVGAARPRWLPVLWASGVAAVVAMAVRVWGGHAAAGDTPWLEGSLQTIHFAAAGVWVGGVLMLLLLLREPGTPPITEARRFSSVAIVAVGLLVGTGLVRAVMQLGGFGEVLDALGRAYGRVLLIKIVLALALIGLGAINRYRSIARLSEDRGPLRRIATAEVLGALGVVVLTATLTSLSPTPPAEAAPGVPLGTVDGTDFAGTTRVELTITPGTPGPNAFRARVLDPAGGDVLPVDGVSLRLRSITQPTLTPVGLDLAPDGDAWVGQSTDLSAAGTWSVTASVRRGSSVVEVPLVVVTRSDGQTPPPGSSFGTTAYPEGVAVSLHLAPGAAGRNDLHVDLTAPNGEPLAPGEVIAVATPDGGAPQRLTPVTSEGRGTVAIPVTLDPGTWTIDVVLRTPDGRSFQGDLFGVVIA